MHESKIALDDMRLVGALVTAGNFTQVARLLGLPKQTVSRRVARLESALGVQLIERSTRSFRMSALGRGYAERCAELCRAADDLNQNIRGQTSEVTGTLRLTADPLFGEHFLPPLIEAFLRAYPAAQVDAVLTNRAVDLIDEGFDVAFRVGAPGDPTLIATRIAEATVVLVASPRYLKARGRPRRPEDLADHTCVALTPEGLPARWAFRDGAGTRWLPIAPRIRVNHLALAREAARAGLGIANLPYFTCSAEVARGTLRLVLADQVAAFGAIHLLHPARRLVTPRVRAFRDLALTRLRARRELRARPG
jgi:DNA-binding transcriptional LysR family regulator